MSGYQVTTPNWFAVQNQTNLLNSQISFLQEQFWRPTPTVVTATGPVVDDYVKGYIVYTGATGTYATPTATQFIDAIQTRLTSIHGTSVVPLPPALRAANNAQSQNLAKPCFSFPVMIHNQSASEIVLTAGSGVVIGVVTSVTIPARQIGYLMVTVEANVSVDATTPNEVYITVIAP